MGSIARRDARRGERFFIFLLTSCRFYSLATQSQDVCCIDSNASPLALPISLRCKSLILGGIAFIASSINHHSATIESGHQGGDDDQDAMQSLLRMGLSCLLMLQTESFLVSCQQQIKGFNNNQDILTQSLEKHLIPPSLLITTPLPLPLVTHASLMWTERKDRLHKSLLNPHPVNLPPTSSSSPAAGGEGGEEGARGGGGEAAQGGGARGLPLDLWMEFGPPRSRLEALSWINTMQQYHLGW